MQRGVVAACFIEKFDVQHRLQERKVYIFISLSVSVVLLKFPLVAIFVWRTVYIFISLGVSVVLLKFPLVAIFVCVARSRTFLSTDQEMGEFMSQSAVRQSGLPRNRGQGVASVAIGA